MLEQNDRHRKGSERGTLLQDSPEKLQARGQAAHLLYPGVIQVAEICKAQESSSRDRETTPRAQGTIWPQTAQISENATGKASRKLASHDRHTVSSRLS